MTHVAVIGAGPAGLMAAETISGAGHDVTVFDAKPSVGRKFLMAGKSGLNLTKNEDLNSFAMHYRDAETPLRPMLEAFGPAAVQDWARGLGQEVFVGSTGRVFPKAMKASPLMRAWLARLEERGVVLRTKVRWRGWDGAQLVFDAATGRETLAPDATVLALGGASWSRLGSDGAWAKVLLDQGVRITAFEPANFGLQVRWSDHMHKHLGAAIKGVRLVAGDLTSQGEIVLSAQGLEGGGLYEVSRGIRSGAPLIVDLLPNLDVETAAQKLSRPIGKASLSNHIRKTLRLEGAKLALALECAHPLPREPLALARCLKSLVIPHEGPRPMDEAISTAGGVPFSEMTSTLMLRAKPGVFCAGEMLDWEAPTGGYLITACLATGRWAGQGALDYLAQA